jgi:hypothetical protein
MKPIYKICELKNELGHSRFIIKYIKTLLWPFWITYKDDWTGPYYYTYEKAIEQVERFKEYDKRETYKIKKCTIIKD